jgi:trigger factor
MQVVVEKLSPVLLEFAVEVEAARVAVELDKAYKQLAKSAKIRGFRPGKAPRHVLAHMYGPRVVRDVAQRLVDETYQEALSKENVQAVSQPAIEVNELKDNEPLAYKARVEIIPTVENLVYEGFEVARPSTAVTPELLSEELEALRKANSTLEPPAAPRAAEKGDTATFDFELLVDGAVVADAGAKDFDAELGAGVVLPELENALLGKQVGETATTPFSFPAAHPNPALAGKDAVFQLVLKDIKVRVLPNLDDDFAKDLGDYATLDALKEALTADIKKRLEENAENALAEALVQELVKANPLVVPPALVRQQSQLTEQEVVSQARARGQQGGVTADMRARIAADSEVKVRAGLLMAEIAKREGLKIGDKELEEGIVELAQQTGKNPAKVRAEYRDAKKREMLIGMILENKVLDIVESKAKITDASAQ